MNGNYKSHTVFLYMLYYSKINIYISKIHNSVIYLMDNKMQNLLGCMIQIRNVKKIS